MVKWDETLATGFKEIDRHHQILLERLELLIDQMRQGKGRQEIDKTIQFLGDYARMHFAMEEQYMEQVHCPAALLNKAQHHRFLENFNRLSARIRQEGNNTALVLEVQRTLSDWVVNHILEIDLQMKKYARD